MRPVGGRALVSTVDYHTAGEPFRIVTGGVLGPAGRTVADRRLDAIEHLDSIRRLLVQEPRGHDGMYGCFPTPPDDSGAAIGAVFFHRSGFSTACGHGTIALANWAVDTGLVAAGVDQFHVDVPSGRVAVNVQRRPNGTVSSVGFRNVAAWVQARSVPVDTPAGVLEVEVAFGGAFYASVPACALGLRVSIECLPQFVAAGRRIQQGLDAAGAARHESDARLSGIYGVTFYETYPVGSNALGQRSVTVFGDGQVDRSPCGSGTSARLALVDGRELARGHTFIHESIIGTRFEARVIGTVAAGDRDAVLTEVRGSASMTGLHHFFLDDDDPIGDGFSLT